MRSLRFRLALFSSAGVAAVFCLVAVFLYYQIRINMVRDIDFMIESKAGVLASSRIGRPLVWGEVEELLMQSGGDMTLLVWQPEEANLFLSKSWPEGLDPREVAAGLTLPEDWRSHLQDSESRYTAPRRPGLTLADSGWRRIATNPLPAGDPLRRYGAYDVGGTTLIMGTDLHIITDRLAGFRNLLLVALVPALLLSFALGAAIAQRSLASLHALVRAIEAVTARGLDRRIAPEKTDREFGRLISVFNAMLERLERSFSESRRFTDAAAHELRSPLTILQGKLDEAMRAEEPGSERQQTLATLMEEVARLKGITDRLLLLARSDAGRLDLYLEPVDLGVLVENLVEDSRALNPQLRYDYEPVHCPMVCDRALMMQLIHNLLSNAAKYNRAENGFVMVKIEPGASEVRLIVANSGPQIPPERHEKIFDRFYRGDESHSRRVEGTGLGLGLAREIAHAHGGNLVLARSAPGETVFVVILPPKSVA